MRAGARVLKQVVESLATEPVLRLLDELADRVQVEDAPVFRKLRGAAVVELRPRVVREAEAELGDGWLLDAERAA